jgi:hypothetical protein
LPVSAIERKKRKPDWEALAALPGSREYPSGSLLALASGSRPNRQRGVLIGLGRNGEPAATEIADLSRLFASFDGQFEETNIEGALVLDGKLLLFQRGNAGSPINAILTFPLERALSALENEGLIPEPVIRHVELGRVEGIPLSFTDAAVAGDVIVFSAVAESTANAYDDGTLVGAAVGTLTPDGRVHHFEALVPLVKVEGIEATVNGDAVCIALVTDADDPQRPACLFSTTLPVNATPHGR